MASIKGFQLKNIKRTLGREGYGCLASIYLNGKKIGTYADYGDGSLGEDKYISKEAEAEMMKVIIAYAKEHPDSYIVDLYKDRPKQFQEECERFKKIHPYIPDEDITIETMSANWIGCIVDDFLSLLEIERRFKKYQKKGFRAVSVNESTIRAYPENWTDEEIHREANGDTLYMSLDDFIQ